MECREWDYYSILNVPRDATKEQITLSYRSLALRYFPQKCDLDYDPTLLQTDIFRDEQHLNGLNPCQKWYFINMAYEVLSNDVLRSVYDCYGECGLYKGVLLPNGFFRPYEYHGNPMRTYNSVFGTFSPCANILDAVISPPNLYSTVGDGIGVRKKQPPVEKLIELNLHEIFNGTVKRMKIMRHEFVDDQQTETEKREKVLLVKIPPGTMAGTRFTFESEGDRGPTWLPGDIVFVTADKPHDVFKRKGCDLIVTHKISLTQALIGLRFNIETLDGRKILISITDVVQPGYTKILPGEGLPVCIKGNEPIKISPCDQQPKKLGNLVIEFDVTYPTNIPREFYARIKKLFDEIECSIAKVQAI